MDIVELTIHTPKQLVPGPSTAHNHKTLLGRHLQHPWQKKVHSTVRRFGANVARNDFRKFILLDQIVLSFNEFEGIDLCIGVEEGYEPCLASTIDECVSYMTPDARSDFLGKSNRLPGCKLTAAIQHFAMKSPQHNQQRK